MPVQEDWRLSGICRNYDPKLWNTDDSQGAPRSDHRVTYMQRITRAKKICQKCPVITECLEYALVNDERFGIWGGKDPDERQREGAKRARRRMSRRL